MSGRNENSDGQRSFHFVGRLTREQFENYHRKNPKIWELFKTFTFRAIQRGFGHLSADMILHRIRWEVYIETVDPSGPFKVSNNYAAFYGRMFMKEYPQYDGFFRTRNSVADWY